MDPFNNLNEYEKNLKQANLNAARATHNQSSGRETPALPVLPSTISRRDYFAAAALQGIIASNDLRTDWSLAVTLAVDTADKIIGILDLRREV